MGEHGRGSYREIVPEKLRKLIDMFQMFDPADRTNMLLSYADQFKEVPPEADFFSLSVSGGEPHRLWIDMTSHVVMARDRRTYRSRVWADSLPRRRSISKSCSTS